MNKKLDAETRRILKLARAIHRQLREMREMVDSSETKLDSIKAQLIDICLKLDERNWCTKKCLDAMIVGDAKLALSYLPDEIRAETNLQ
jgi:hypothetical protein